MGEDALSAFSTDVMPTLRRSYATTASSPEQLPAKQEQGMMRIIAVITQENEDLRAGVYFGQCKQCQPSKSYSSVSSRFYTSGGGQQKWMVRV